MIFAFSLFGFSSSSIYKRLFQSRAKTGSDMVSWFFSPQETGDKFLGNFNMNPSLECRCSFHKMAVAMAVVHASLVDSFISLLEGEEGDELCIVCSKVIKFYILH